MHALSFRDIVAGIIALIGVSVIAYQSVLASSPSVEIVGITTLAVGYFLRGAENGGLITPEHSGYVGRKIDEEEHVA